MNRVSAGIGADPVQVGQRGRCAIESGLGFLRVVRRLSGGVVRRIDGPLHTLRLADAGGSHLHSHVRVGA
jgi:hypothetical protein